MPDDGRIHVAAVDATVEGVQRASVTGVGSDRVGAITIDGGYGQVLFNGTGVQTYVHERIPWPEFGYVLYQGLAVTEQEWFVFWFYCQQDTGLEWVYYESTHGQALDVEKAEGTCSEDAGDVEVEFPATNMSKPLPNATATIDGERIQLSGGAGWLLHEETNWTVYPFQTVDCSTECGDPGWLEVHVLLWNQTAQEAAFAILYLHEEAPSEVSMLYGLDVPPLGRVEATFVADWSQ